MTDTTGPGSSYFERVGAHRFVPTVHAGGAWADDEQHVSPLAGLVVHEIERVRAQQSRPDLLMSRVSFDILGRIAFEEFDIRVDVVRPGRTVELVQATVDIGGRSVLAVRAWFMSAQDTAEVAGGGPDPLPAPDALPVRALTSVWKGGYIASIDARAVGEPEPGRAAAWVSTPLDLVAGEQASDLASYIALVDTANGIAVREDPADWMFPNMDLTIHLYRQPEGRWTGLDTAVTFGRTGHGLTSTALHDINGPVGCAQQILTVRAQPERQG